MLDSAGTAHLVWIEAAAGDEGSEILYSRCPAATCTPAVQLSNQANLDCLSDPTPQNDGPAIALDRDNTLMVSWRNGERNLLYSTWPATGPPPQMPTGCLPPGDGPIGSGPRVGGADGVFRLVNEQNGNIYLTDYAADRWSSSPELLGQGSAPDIFVDAQGQNHVAWCGPDQTLSYRNETGPTEQIPFPGCTGRPGLAQSENGFLRLVWHSDQVQNVTGVVHPNSLIYETFKTESGWSEPAIIAQAAGSTQPVLAPTGSGSLHLAWADESSLNYTSHTDYDCANVPLSHTSRVVFDTVRQEKFRPPTDPIPYCHNQYEGLIYVPNPEPAYSSDSPTPNGPFDKFAELAKTAQYEVLFATMWYDDFSQAENPGRVLASGIAELYRNLKVDPARYPRGITVRILLGNPPPLALFPNLNHQVWQVMDDLRAAGIPELENDEIGWKVEIANFDATWLHSPSSLWLSMANQSRLPATTCSTAIFPRSTLRAGAEGE